MTLRWSLLLLALTACPGRITDPEPFKQCMLDVEADIFVPKCGTMTGCHTTVSPANGLDLQSPGMGTRIATGVSTSCMNKPYLSYIVEKVTVEIPSCGSPMPTVGDPLTPGEVKCLKDYLASLTDGGT